MSAAPAGAATLGVTTTFDETTAGDGACSLREAIAAVNAPGSASGDCTPAAFGANTIALKAGTYTLGNQFPGQHSELLIASTITNLTITGAGEGQTTIDAAGLGNRVLEIPSGAAVTVSNLTIKGGHAPGGSAASDAANGGAILNAGTLTLTDAAISSSTAGSGAVGGAGTSGGSTGGAGSVGGFGGSGGGIFNTGTLTLQGATIAGNRAGDGGSGGAGGQGTSDGGAGGAGGTGGAGGGIYNGGGTLTVTGSTIRGNTSGSGGAGGNGGAGGSGTGGAGGSGGIATAGGGIASVAGTIAITNSTFASNVAGNGAAGGAGGAGPTAGGVGGAGGNGGSGGAVAAIGPSSAALQSITVAGNSAGSAGSGGAAATGSPGGGPGSAGTAGSAGGLLDVGPAATVQNSLLASNSGGNCSGSILDQGHNLTFAGGGCPVTFASADPNLGPLDDNGGPTQTISLGSGSAALDKVPPTGAGCQATDQRGVPRPVGSACDIGAYESAGPKATTAAPSAVGSTTATLNGSVTPNAGTATVEFDYGTTTKYGAKVVQTLGGVTATPVLAKVSRLKPKTVYHFRIVVTALDGTVTTPDRAFTTSPPPVLARLSIKPHAFKAGGRGATITYTDSQPAKVTFVVLRPATGVKHGKRCVAPPTRGRARGGKCTRFVAVGTFTHTDKAGANSVRFTGKLRGRKLARGSYRLEATGRANGQTGKTVATTFRITG